MGMSSFRRASSGGDRERAEQLGREVQVLEHVIKVAFKNGMPTKVGPDAKHMEYVAHAERKAREALPKKDRGHPNRWIIPQWHPDMGDPAPAFEMLRILAVGVMRQSPDVYDITFNPYEEGYMELIFEIDGKQFANINVVDGEDENLRYGFFPISGEEAYHDTLAGMLEEFTPETKAAQETLAPEDTGEFLWLDPEVRADIVPLSNDPTIAALQQRLRGTILELREAEEERQPGFITNKIRSRMAQAHEALVEARARRYY